MVGFLSDFRDVAIPRNDKGLGVAVQLGSEVKLRVGLSEVEVCCID